jgi:hypothetical protein
VSSMIRTARLPGRPRVPPAWHERGDGAKWGWVDAIMRPYRDYIVLSTDSRDVINAYP